jgi:hypothetical protein
MREESHMASTNLPLDAEELAQALTCGDPGCTCGRRAGSGYLTHCAAHDDRNPSLSITDGNGRILVYCFAGCSQEAVIKALREQGLWSYASALDGRPAEYRGEAILRWYDYFDIDGSLAYAVGRTASKQFPIIRADGRGGWSWGLGEQRGRQRIPYRLPELLNADPRKAVLIVEGEKDADRLAHLGLVATTNLGGAGKWHLTDQEPFRDRGVIIIPDNDDAGLRHARAVARSLHSVARHVLVLDPLPRTGPGGDVSDFLDAGGTVEELGDIAMETWRLRSATEEAPRPRPSGEPVPSASVDTDEGPVLITLSEVRPERVSWLWEPYIPLGKIAIVQGDPSVGKSWLTLAIATAVTTGTDLSEVVVPAGSALRTGVKPEPADVLILTAEDGLADTVRPRLDAMGAVAVRVRALKAIRDTAGQEHHPSLVRDLGHLERVLAGGGFKLVIIDPLNAYLGTDLDTHRDAAVRAVLTPLASLAERYGVAIICVQHLTKGGRDRPIYRGLGSIAYIAAARVVLLVGQNPDDERERVLVPIKNNLGRLPSALAFEIKDGRFLWRGESSVTAEALLAPRGGHKEQSDLSEAIAFLEQALADGPRKAKELLREASDAGISPTTLKRAKKARGAGARRRQEGFGGKRGYWEWFLPQQSAQKDQPPTDEPRDPLSGSQPKTPPRPSGSGSLVRHPQSAQEDQVLQHGPVAPLCEVEPETPSKQGAPGSLVSDPEHNIGGGRTCRICGGPNDEWSFPYCRRCWRRVMERMDVNGE